jgi:hypothetical protein
MYSLIPFLDLDPNDVEPLRLFIDRNDIRQITGTFPAEERL